MARRTVKLLVTVRNVPETTKNGDLTDQLRRIIDNSIDGFYDPITDKNLNDYSVKIHKEEVTHG